MNLLDLANISQGTLRGESSNVESFSIDTRTIKPKEVYIALKGENFDGHLFITEAIKKRASAIVLDRQVECNIPNIIVDDSYKFMNHVAVHNRNYFKGKMVGITGTNGKTTTKQIIANLLNSQGSCHQTIGNKNNQIGVPYSLLTLGNNHDYSVIEMGTSEPGEIKKLNTLVKPDIAAITNVSIGHLDGLRDTESIAIEKGNILNFWNEDGTAILPRDSNFYEYWSNETNAKQIISFGIHDDSDFKVSSIKIDVLNNLTHFRLRFDGKEENFSINGIGKHNPLNAALAIAVSILCGVETNSIKNNLTNTQLPERRLDVCKSLKGSILIDDSYNSNPASLRNALDSIDELKRKKLCILGEMKELGSNSQKLHQEMYEYASERVDKILCIGKEWSGCDSSDDLLIFKDHDALYDHLVSIIENETILLVKGSRSTRMDKIADKLKK
jgi:UDP-N-acetylmuramoyl-tripeptide--D-alanyl-D-alanine ligase